MNTSITLALDTRKSRKKKDNTFPIVLRISHGRSSLTINLGYSVKESDWDETNRQIKPTSKVASSITRLNNRLTKKKAEAVDVIVKLEESDQLPSLSVKEIKEMIQAGNKPRRNSFFKFTEQLIADMKKAQQFGNARVYQATLSGMRTYMKGRDLCFEDITYKFLKDYETEFYARGNSVNGLSVKMRTIRAIYNKAIKSKLVDRSLYPFADYQIKNQKTEKRALDKSDLMKIVNLDLDPGHELHHARNFFLISYNMYGMNFIDMAFLQVKHVKDGRISYRRRKTSRLYDVHMTKPLAALLSPYLFGKQPEEFVFPILTRSTLSGKYDQVRTKQKKYNDALKKIAAEVGIDMKLTSYVARHSFATQAVWNDVPLKAIQEMLGHESLKTTEVYISDLPKKVMDEYGDRLALG